MTRSLAIALVVLAACGGDEEAVRATAPAPRTAQARPADVDEVRLVAADRDAANWITHGRTYSEQRFSPLEQVNADTVSGLTRAWSFETGLDRGHEATPLVIDGVMYLTGSWSVVFALDARSGKLLWKWDPAVDRRIGEKLCCDAVNRGVAAYDGKIFVGVLDGRLAALDARTGRPVWEVVTVDQTRSYTITGAPRVVKGRVLIGNGGAEFGVRGYLSAYDADDGTLVWRTYTVPGDPSEPFESEALEAAASTWKGGEWWKLGGGGTVWDAIAYDPELDQVYVGTGNGSPWTRYLRSPGGGDNLYLSSILALDPDNGEILWHFQTTPGDNFDFTATQQIVLADLVIGGRLRKVLMQAPKNGFFYVLDRETGAFISADNFVEVTWALGIDPDTGRPIPNPEKEYADRIALVKPMYLGGHNWQPMSFNPQTGLVYIPAQEIMGVYGLDKTFAVHPTDMNTGVDASFFALFTEETAKGHLLAWDPVAQREAWRHPYSLAWNGGTLTTAGNLVFQGTADGRFLALRADTGTKLWEAQAGTGVIAGPITYAVDGTQYVSVVAGWGGALALVAGPSAAAAGVRGGGRVLTWALSDQPITVELVEAFMAARDPSTRPGNDAYHRWCVRCHGSSAVGGGVVKDLRGSTLGQAAFVRVVTNGVPSKGMPAFGATLTPEDLREIYAYVRAQAGE